jgi:hypothetical protein
MHRCGLISAPIAALLFFFLTALASSAPKPTPRHHPTQSLNTATYTA